MSWPDTVLRRTEELPGSPEIEMTPPTISKAAGTLSVMSSSKAVVVFAAFEAVTVSV